MTEMNLLIRNGFTTVIIWLTRKTNRVTGDSIRGKITKDLLKKVFLLYQPVNINLVKLTFLNKKCRHRGWTDTRTVSGSCSEKVVTLGSMITSLTVNHVWDIFS